MSFTALTNEYQSHIRRKIMWILLALVILIILAAAAVCIGVADLTPARLAVTWLPLSDVIWMYYRSLPRRRMFSFCCAFPVSPRQSSQAQAWDWPAQGCRQSQETRWPARLQPGFRRSGPGCRRSDYLQRNTCLFSKNRYGHGRFPDGSHLRRIRLRFIKPEGFGSRNARFNRYRTELLLQCT